MYLTAKVQFCSVERGSTTRHGRLLRGEICDVYGSDRRIKFRQQNEVIYVYICHTFIPSAGYYFGEIFVCDAGYTFTV